MQEYRDHGEVFFKVYVMDDEVMVFRRPSLPNLDDLARAVAAALRGTSARDLSASADIAVSDNGSDCDSASNGSGSGESKPEDTAGGSASRSVAGGGSAQCRYHGLRSVAFDSRFAYPTAADFVDPSVIPSYDDLIAASPVAVAGGTHVAMWPPTPSPLPAPVMDGAPPSVLGRNSVSPVNGSSRTSVLSSEGRARKPSAKDLHGTGLSVGFPPPAPVPVLQCAPPQATPLATPGDAAVPQAAWSEGEASAEEKMHPPGNGADAGYPNGCSRHVHNHLPVPEQEYSNEIKPTSASFDALSAPRHGFDFSLSAGNLGSLSQERFRAAALAIQQEFGLSLFGFDVIVPTTKGAAVPTSHNGKAQRCSHGVIAERARSPSSGSCGSIEDELGFSLTLDQADADAYDLVVIDVNYFPSYKEVPDFPQRLRKFLRKKAGML